MTEKTLSAPRQKAAFTGQVIARLLSRSPNKSLLQVRLMHGQWSSGPAQLLDDVGHAYDVTILGAAIVDGRRPEESDPRIDFIMIEGVAAGNIKPEQLLIQQANAR